MMLKAIIVWMYYLTLFSNVSVRLHFSMFCYQFNLKQIALAWHDFQSSLIYVCVCLLNQLINQMVYYY